MYIIYIYINIGDYHYIHYGKVVLDDLIFQILVAKRCELRCETLLRLSLPQCGLLVPELRQLQCGERSRQGHGVKDTQKYGSSMVF